MTIPGIDMVVAVGMMAAIGRIDRFAAPEKLGAYLGLNPSVRQAGDGRAHHGRIAKRGSSQARHFLVEAAWQTVRSPDPTAKTGTPVDATVIASASRGDQEATRSGHRARKAIHGDRAHLSAEADTGPVERLDVTPGNVHDGRAGGAVVPDILGVVHADRADRGSALASAVTGRGGEPMVVATHVWAREATQRRRRRFSRATPQSTGPGEGREDLRHMEAQLRLASNAMARPSQRRPPDSPYRHRP